MNIGDIVGILVDAVIIWFLVSLVLRLLNYFMLEKIKTSIRQDLGELIREVEVEMHQHLIYWYDKENGSFLGQGQNDSELINHVRSRFPDGIFIVPNKGILSSPDWKFQTNGAQIKVDKIINL